MNDPEDQNLLKTAGLIAQTMMSASGLDLTLIPHVRRRTPEHIAEVARLERQNSAMLAGMDRYADSRLNEYDDKTTELVLDRRSQTETKAPNSFLQSGTKSEQENIMSAHDKIRQTVDGNDVVLFMKGTKMMPQCGFSSKVAGVLNYMGVEFADVNVLADAEIRQGIKDFSDWPTIPQLYVKGEFVGGCDIITEMTLSGELDQLFEAKGVVYNKDAAAKIREANA